MCMLFHPKRCQEFENLLRETVDGSSLEEGCWPLFHLYIFARYLKDYKFFIRQLGVEVDQIVSYASERLEMYSSDKTIRLTKHSHST